MRLDPVPPPVLADDTYATDEDTPLTVAGAEGLLANDDISALPASVYVTVQPQLGELALSLTEGTAA